MKQKIINGRWVLWTTDAIADWDGGTGDYSARRGWEFERFESFRKHLRWGDTFYDIGAEHGWISAIIAREFVGAENMVLFEPSPEFWVNIRRIWEYNGLADPKGCWQGFVGRELAGERLGASSRGVPWRALWPECADASRPEVPGMAYRSLLDPASIPTITVDDFAGNTLLWPSALNIDVEGAELLVLKGAVGELLEPDGSLRNVWVSIHPDLLERDFGSTKQDVIDFMASCGWTGEHLGTDHEEHHHFTRTRL